MNLHFTNLTHHNCWRVTMYRISPKIEECVIVHSTEEVKSLKEKRQKPICFICEECKKQSFMSFRNVVKKTKLLCEQCQRDHNNLIKYGVKNVYSLQSVKDKKAKTYMEKYGSYPQGNPEIAKKIKQTKIERYGKSLCDLDKKNKTCMERYGVTFPDNKNDEIHIKSRQTMLDKYGSFIVYARYKYDNIFFDSSWELYYYIYEKYILHNDIQRYEGYIEYKFKNKTRRYYPDFLCNNRIVEIKGDQLMKELLKEGTVQNAKFNCMKEHNVNILCYEQLKEVFDKVDSLYGKNYVKSFRIF